MALDPLDPIVRPILRVLSMMAINTNYGFIIYTQVRMTKLLVINTGVNDTSCELQLYIGTDITVAVPKL